MENRLEDIDLNKGNKHKSILILLFARHNSGRSNKSMDESGSPELTPFARVGTEIGFKDGIALNSNSI